MSNRRISTGGFSNSSGRRLKSGDNDIVSVKGPTSVYTNSVQEYEITDYDSSRQYSINAISGSVSIVDDVITYIAPAVSGVSGFIVNGVRYSITTLTSKIVKPTLLTPTSGSTNTASAVTMTISAFSLTNGADTHQSTSWQIATNSSFKNPVVKLDKSTDNLTSLTVYGLSANTKYYVRFKQFGTSLDQSVWSEAYNFTTKPLFYPENEISLLGNNSRAANDKLGTGLAVSADGKMIVSGAPFGSSNNFIAAGYILIHEHQNGVWVQTNKLEPSVSATNLNGCASIAISTDGQRIVVGFPYTTCYNGTTTHTLAGTVIVYVKVDGAWEEEAVLQSMNLAPSEFFGSSLDINADGTVIAVAAHGYNNKRGAVYVFKRPQNVWVGTIRLTASGATSADNLGSSVSISDTGDVIAVGAHLGTATFNKAGKVYVYRETGTSWTESMVVAADPAANAYFGWSTDISGDGTKLIVGAYNLAVNGLSGAGAAYIFTHNGSSWSQTIKIPATSERNGQVGYSVAISDNGLTALIGAPGCGPTGNLTAGGVWVFTLNSTWKYVKKIIRANYAPYEYFGTVVDVSGNGSVGVAAAPAATVAGYATAGAVCAFQ